MTKNLNFVSDENPVGTLPNDAGLRARAVPAGEHRRPELFRTRERRIWVKQVVQISTEARGIHIGSTRHPVGLKLGGICSHVASFQPEIFISDPVVRALELFFSDRVSKVSADGVIVDLVCRN